MKMIVMRKETGITLIALMITVVVLIILAGVSINLTIGTDGLITRAKQAAENMEVAATEEKEMVNELYATLNKYVDKIAPENAKIELVSISNNTIILNVISKDNESGVELNRCKYLLNTSPEAIEDENLYTENINEESQDIELTLSSEGTYYLHVLTMDKSGNKTETISNPIELIANYHEHVSSCYTTKTTRCTGTNRRYSSSSACPNNCNNWNKTHYHGEVRCDRCGNSWPVAFWDAQNGGVDGSCTRVLSTEQVLNCTKTDTIESYTITY